MPLIEHLSNGQIISKLDVLLNNNSVTVPVRVQAPLCRCGCGAEVADGRKFVNQAHYDRWRSPPPRDAERLITSYQQGAPKRQLAEEHGISLSAVRRLLKKHSLH